MPLDKNVLITTCVIPIAIPLIPLIMLLLLIIYIDDRRNGNKQMETEEERRKRVVEQQRFRDLHIKKLDSLLTVKTKISDGFIEKTNKFLHGIPYDHLSPLDQLRAQLREQDYDYQDSFDYSYILKNLDSLRLSKGYKLGIDSDVGDNIGTHCSYYIYKDILDRKKYLEYDIFKHIEVDWTEQGIWQAYILDRSWHRLPVTWHGAYDTWTFVSEIEQVETIRDNLLKIEKYNTLKLAHMNIRNTVRDLKPYVIISDDKTAYVCCYHWRDFGGLNRDDVVIEKDNNGRITIKDIREVCVFSYWPKFRY